VTKKERGKETSAVIRKVLLQTDIRSKIISQPNHIAHDVRARQNKKSPSSDKNDRDAVSEAIKRAMLI